jgi:Leucine-rich repeat (LRR) protein
VLQVLHLDDNELESLPYGLFHMPQLRVLTLSHNRLQSTCIPEIIDEGSHPVQLQANTPVPPPNLGTVLPVHVVHRRWFSTSTTWAGSLGESAPSSGCRCGCIGLRCLALLLTPSLQLLSCENNCIPVLPPEFRECRQLTEVNLGCNAFEIMPEGIKNITTLQVMALQHDACSLCCPVLTTYSRCVRRGYDLRATASA